MSVWQAGSYLERHLSAPQRGNGRRPNHAFGGIAFLDHYPVDGGEPTRWKRRLTVGQASMPSFRGVVISACALCDRFFREINIRTHAFVAERTDYESVAIRGFAVLLANPVCQMM